MELLERDIPLQELQTAWHNAAAGNGRMTLISGEAGIGKTSLVESFIQNQEQKQRVLWGACDGSTDGGIILVASWRTQKSVPSKPAGRV